MGVIGKNFKIVETRERVPSCTKVGFSVYFEDRSEKKKAIMDKQSFGLANQRRDLDGEKIEDFLPNDTDLLSQR